MQDSKLGSLRHQIASSRNAYSQTQLDYEGSCKNLNSVVRGCPNDEWAFSPLDFTAGWRSHLALTIYMFVVVNFDALPQASDFRIERRQVVFFCWMHDSKLGSLRHQIVSRLNAHSQTDWVIEYQVKVELDSPSLWWATYVISFVFSKYVCIEQCDMRVRICFSA